MDAKIVNYEEAKALVDAGAKLVDVRTPLEYKESCCAGLLNLPLDRVLDDYEDVLGADKHKSIVLCCRSGNRSAKAASLLRGLGYQNLYDLEACKNWLG